MNRRDGYPLSSNKAMGIDKKQRKIQRELERQKQQQRMRWLIGITGVVVAALIVAAILYTPKSKAVDFAYDELPVLGSKDAPVKIVEFGDYKCPVCAAYSQQIIPLLKKDYVDTGKAAVYFMNFTFIGPDSFTAALAGQAVYHQNNDEFWKFYDAVYKNQGNEKVQWATPEFLVDLAKKEKLNIDYDKLLQDIKSGTYADEVNAHNAKAQSLTSSTPTIFINGVKFEEFGNYEAMKAAIDKALKEGAK